MTLHITSPVKQKQQYLQMYREILTDYRIITERALDEGISVLYNSISNQIENNTFEENTEYQGLIIDCGGGTTDLTSCKYYIVDNQITFKLDLITTYANGETNFGGNNITYRIFQYLKILFARYYDDDDYNIRLESIFETELTDIYRNVDSAGITKVYQKFEEMYDDCEQVIPTRYGDYRHTHDDFYMKVRSNFYFLWNLAEKIKIDFFQTSNINQTSFHTQGVKLDKNDPKVLPEESWRLYVNSAIPYHVFDRNIHVDTKGLKLRTDYPNIVITKDEAVMLIKADIYWIIKKFIEPLYIEDDLSHFNFIKLTGQTCKIDVFRDALKEFIPGRVIDTPTKMKTVRDFKLICLEGAIKCQNARAIGLIAPTIKNDAPVTPYKLIALTHIGAETVMIASLQELTTSYGYVSRNIDTENVELYLRDAEDRLLHTYLLRTNVNNFKETNYVETTQEFADKILQDDIDTIIDGEIKIFTYAVEDKWGFYAMPLARRRGTLLAGERVYFPFENDEWEINFFDGGK